MSALEVATKALEDMPLVADGDVEVLDELEEISAETLARQGEEAPVIKLVNVMLMSAIQKGASDIHIEPYEKELRVRYRIDGILYNVMNPPMKFRDAITSRIKIMSKLDIAEKRLPQDGRIKIRFADNGAAKDIDFRVSCLPTLFGEKIVMRLLDKDKLMLDMTKLGFEAESLAKFEAPIQKPWGMVLVTGPTGSGKTNTLYSSISRINTPDTNIMTAEDPVEFNLPGINQVQVRENIGLNFAAALRAFLRQDPNIILVGEIRDFETAEIAVKAALTGHLVLSTLHTNDAPSTVNRLMNMGIEPFLVASSVNLICAQRLVRRVCQVCKEPHPHAGAGARAGGVLAGRRAAGRADARQGLREVQQHRLQGPRRSVRGHGSHRRTARAGARRRVGARAAAQGDRGRDAHAPPERPAQGQGRRDDDRGSRQGDGEVDRRRSRRRSVGRGPIEYDTNTCTTTLPELLKQTVELQGSDLHLTTNTPPQVRVHGHCSGCELPDLTPADTKQLAYSVLTDAQKKRFEETLELDFSFGIRGLARFRCNMFNQRGAVGAVYRLIPETIRSFDELGLPPVLATLADRPRGLVLVTGPTGSGKSTTLAAMIDKINTRAPRSHPHDRGSDRVHPPAQGLPGQPARSAQRHAELHAARCAPPCAKTRTSSSSAKCATSRRWNPRCASRRRAT